jgi:NADH dehydrogenase
MKTIVIVGGGAGGLELATRLGHRYGKKNKAKIILVDRNRNHIWKPLLHEVAMGSLDINTDGGLSCAFQYSRLPISAGYNDRYRPDA